ncbi:MAG: hypothetical protein SGARI_003775, partial [Bacillariaceae sp.]
MCFSNGLGDKAKTKTAEVGEDEKLMLTNSREILYFLSKRFPEAGLYPKKHQKAIDAFIDSYYAAFSSIGAFLYGHLSRKSPEMRDFLIHGSYNTKIEKLEMLVALTQDDLKEVATQKLQRTKKMDLPKFLDEVDLNAVDQSLTVLLDQMETMLGSSKKRTYLVGETFTLADIAGIVFCARIHYLKDTAMFGPLVSAYWQHMRHRPTVGGANVVAEWHGSSFAELFEEFKNNAQGHKRKRNDLVDDLTPLQ